MESKSSEIDVENKNNSISSNLGYQTPRSREVIEKENKFKKGSDNIAQRIFDSIFGRIKAQEKINFARNLGSMLAAGLSMRRALAVMEVQSGKKFKSVLGRIDQAI